MSELNHSILVEHPRVAMQERLQHVDKRIRILEQESLDLKAERNSFLPVSQLPVEVLTRIFMLLACSGNDWWNWLIITKICRYWRNIALGYFDLWTEIRDFWHEEKLQTFLGRSRGADLIITLGKRLLRRSENDLLRVYELLEDHMGRVKEFTVMYDFAIFDWIQIQALILQCTRRLKRLHLRSQTSPESRQYRGKLQHLGSFPLSIHSIQLDCIYLDGISLPWSSSIMHGLSELHLANAPYERLQPTMNEILDILQASPKLKILHLDDIGPRDENDSDTKKHSVNLSCLERINISNIDFSVCVELLKWIVIPRNTIIAISCRRYPFYLPIPFAPAFLDDRNKLTDLNICVQDHKISFRSDVNWDDDNPPPNTLLELYFDVWNDSRIRVDHIIIAIDMVFKQTFWKDAFNIEIELNINDLGIIDDLDKNTWCRLLDALPKHIQILSIKLPEFSESALTKDFVGAFSESSSSDTPHDYRFSELRDFTLTNGTFMLEMGEEAHRKLLEYMKQRNRHGKGHCEILLD